MSLLEVRHHTDKQKQGLVPTITTNTRTTEHMDPPLRTTPDATTVMRQTTQKGPVDMNIRSSVVSVEVKATKLSTTPTVRMKAKKCVPRQPRV